MRVGLDECRHLFCSVTIGILVGRLGLDWLGATVFHKPRAMIQLARLVFRLQSRPVVYAFKNKAGWDTFDKKDNNEYATHKARLMFIEEIVKESCKHEPYKNTLTRAYQSVDCKHCGVELVADWKVK